MGHWENPFALAARNIFLRRLPGWVVAKSLLELMNYDPFKVALNK